MQYEYMEKKPLPRTFFYSDSKILKLESSLVRRTVQSFLLFWVRIHEIVVQYIRVIDNSGFGTKDQSRNIWHRVRRWRRKYLLVVYLGKNQEKQSRLTIDNKVSQVI
jgi:hypothetical protein